MKTSQSRRHFIKSSAAVGALALLPAVGRSASKALHNPLPIPELLTPETIDDVSSYKLNAQSGTMNFFPGIETRTQGYNGNYLGPTIREKNGNKVKIAVNNKLTEITTVHWHGMMGQFVVQP